MSKFKDPRETAASDPVHHPHQVASDSGERIGGDLGYHRSRWKRAIELAKANQDHEIRIDTDNTNITSLEQKYAKEFAIAEKKMEERKKEGGWSDTFRMRVKYDHANDPMYKAWLEDKERAKEVLHIHMFDDWLDHPVVLCSHACKVTTALGGLQGAYKAYSLWKSIDIQYAKLNGVTFRALLVQEASLGILKGAAMGVAFGFGTLVGDNFHRVFNAFVITDHTGRERRKWQAIPTATTFGAVCSSAVAGFFMRDLLTFRGKMMLLSAGGSLGLMVGAAGGYFSYKPFAEKYPQEYDTPWWRPWNERAFYAHGPAGIRGRYV